MAIGGRTGRRLYRSRNNRMIAGVVGGIAEYFGIDPTILRVIWVLVSIVLAPMILLDVVLYIILAMIIPTEPSDL